MKKSYTVPKLHCEEFAPNQYIAGCALNIVSGTDTVKVYCVKTSYITVFTSAISCTYQREPFTSTSEAERFFGQLFQWGNSVKEGGSTNNDFKTKEWTEEQRSAANAEIDNGWTLNSGTIQVGNPSGNMVHAGYCIDYLNGFEEGKAIS